MTRTLLSLGHGYTARWLARRLARRDWRIIGTLRDMSAAPALAADGVEAVAWERSAVERALAEATFVLSSIAPDADGDPALRLIGPALAERARDLDWVGYLSTTGVYGDHGGGWVDEDTPLTPGTRRGRWRVRAEAEWQAIPGLPLHIFRLAGIYGPGRGPFSKVRAGTARRIVKPGQVFSRIHVEDIAKTLEASMNKPAPGAVYNVCDDAPAPPEDVIGHAAGLLGVPLPPEIDFATADLSPMARSFYAENKRVSNARLKRELAVRLEYPDYRAGLKALLERETGEGRR